jgi:hypothetical protein
MVEPNGQQQVLEKQWKQCLPTHLIVLFDSLSNVDFVNLTKRTLKEKVEAVKVAVAKEFAKRDGKLSLDPPEVKKTSESSRRRSPSPDTHVSSSTMKRITNNVSSSQGKSRPTLDITDVRPREGRGRDQNGMVSRTANNSNNQLSENTSSLLPNRKGINNKTTSSVCPPKFSDLIKMASTSKESSSREVNGSRSSNSDPASPPNPTPSRSRNPNPDPYGKRRSDAGHSNPKSRSSQDTFSRIDDRSRSNARPSQNVIENGRSRDRHSEFDPRRSQPGIQNRDRQQLNDNRSGRLPVDSRSHSVIRGNASSMQRPNPARLHNRGNSRDSNASNNSNDNRRMNPTNRSRRDNCDNYDDIPKKDKSGDKKMGSRMKRKEEDERIEELKKQRIRDEQERIKLRNAALNGQRAAQAELKTMVSKNQKTFVSQSQGSTVLSCGKPPVPSRKPMGPPSPEDNRRRRRAYDEYNDDRERRPMRPPPPPGMNRDRDRYQRRPMRYDPSYPDEYDEEEYDPEMDDFIDDDADDNNGFIDDGDVSHHIREIFGYDKRKYRDVDDDDIEEASFATIQKEEARSARLGRKEDLEDMRKEAMEKAQKKKRKYIVDDDDEDDYDR